jgi:A/G-specific adenine glycosylase
VVRRLWAIAESLLPRKGRGEFNQALMELGATVCTPRNPNCTACPVASHCLANKQSLTDSIPAAKPRKATTPVTIQCLVCRNGGAILFRRRPDTGLWAGMWELPSTESARAGRNLLSALAPPGLINAANKPTRLGEVVHQLTHRTVKLVVHEVKCGRASVGGNYQWFEIKRPPPLPTAFAKAFRFISNRSKSSDGVAW